MVAQSFTNFATNSANPYYLHPNENPALILVSSPLDDKNYHTWSRSMQISLISKNRDKFINGTLPKPVVSGVLYAPWIRCNTMVLAWIQRSISASIARLVLWIDTIAGVWKNLQVRFSHSDIFRIFDIQEDLYKFRHVIPVVGNTKESITLNVSHDAQPNKSNSYRGKYQGAVGSRGQNRVCTHCGRNNHTIDTCFIKHGYLPGFKNKTKGNGFSSQQSATANNASETPASGSSSTNPSYGLTQEQYNNILALLQHSKPISTANSVSTSPLVLNSLSSTANGKSPSLWILDTGATDHISFNLSAFTSYHNIVPISVTLLNGSQLSASISSSIKLTPSLTLHNVL